MNPLITSVGFEAVINEDYSYCFLIRIQDFI